MEKRTGKKPREVIGWKRQRQEDNRQREGREERQERSMFDYFQTYNLSQLNSIFTKVACICLQKRKREKKKSNRVRRNRQYLNGQLGNFVGCTLTTYTNSDKQSSATSVNGPLWQQEKCLTNPDFIVFWSSILHLLLHRVLILPAALPQSPKMR